MNIKNDIVSKLRDIDLSTEAAVVEKYEALANSPLLIQFLLHSNLSEAQAAYSASRQKPETIVNVFRSSLRDYATIGRSRNKRSTLKAIRRRIAMLFAEWEAEEKAGGAKASDGHIYAYAIEKGFNPDGASLSETDKAALDEVAECIFTTIEAYFLHSLTEAETAVDGILSHKAGEVTQAELKRLYGEAERQINVLFAPEWENAGDGLTTSCEEEVNFFGSEANAYAIGVIKALASDMEQAAQLRKIENACYSLNDEEEAASMKRAQESRYKELLNE